MSDTLAPQHQSENNSIPFLTKLIATGFYSGYSPIVPGTTGTLVGIAFYLIPGFENLLSIVSITTVVFFIGVLASKQMEKHLGEDPPPVVIDEIIGMWISLIFLPKRFILGFLAFIFFRIFDIIKPQPARYVEKFRNGWGIMLDDVVSGIYANLATQFIILIFPYL